MFSSTSQPQRPGNREACTRWPRQCQNSKVSLKLFKKRFENVGWISYSHDFVTLFFRCPALLVVGDSSPAVDAVVGLN